MSLKLNYVNYKMAKFACEKWHYSRSLPSGKLVKIGVFENDRFIGVVIFSRGANNNLLKPYNLKITEGCELTRIALRDHSIPVTRIMSISRKMLKKLCPNLKLIISFADDRQNHIGTIYQADNWIYTGYVKSTPEYLIRGKWRHQRSCNSLFGSLLNLPKDTKKRDGGIRYRFLFPLNEETRKNIIKLKQEHIHKQSIESDALFFQTEKGLQVPPACIKR